jgi:hypothetical protein
MPPFDLFISYARSDVVRDVGGKQVGVVRELKRRLETHVHPDDRRRRFRVCTDVDDLELDGTVSQAIAASIAQSDHLLVICSESAASRPYVVEEVAVYGASHPAAKLLAAYLDVQPEVAFPLLFERGTLAADLRPQSDATVRSWREQLERESHKVVARCWDVPVARVFDRFVAERRRQHRGVAAGIAAALLVTCISIAAAAGDWGLHKVATLPLPERVVLPAAVGLANGASEAVLAGKSIWRWRLDDNRRATSTPSVRYPLDAHIYEDGRVLVLERSGLTLFHRDGSSRTIATPRPYEHLTIGGAGGIALTSQRGDLTTGDLDGRWSDALRPVTTSLRWAPAVFQERGPLRYGESAVWSADGAWLATATATGQLTIVHPRDWHFLKGTDPVVYETHDTRPIGGMVFLENPNRLLFVEGTLGLRVVDMTNGVVKPLALPQLPLVRDFQLDRQHGMLIGTTSETIEIFAVDGSTIRWLRRVSITPKSLPRIALSPRGDLLLVGYFDDPPDLFRWTWRLFGVDLWTRR